jgi:hypothetical protein
MSWPTTLSITLFSSTRSLMGWGDELLTADTWKSILPVRIQSCFRDSRVAAARDVPDVAPAPADASGAKAALDRIAIPADVADRIAGIISPRSSVIVSDEALSPETGNGTEFVVVMNDEPQGGIKNRTRHER